MKKYKKVNHNTYTEGRPLAGIKMLFYYNRSRELERLFSLFTAETSKISVHN